MRTGICSQRGSDVDEPRGAEKLPTRPGRKASEGAIRPDQVHVIVASQAKTPRFLQQIHVFPVWVPVTSLVLLFGRSLDRQPRSAQ